MKEVVVISGKGGTGKTSLVAALAHLAAPLAVADCDVDAADLHLVLSPRLVAREDFSGGHRARILPETCSACGLCHEICRFDAVEEGPPFTIDPIACEGCGVCAHFCPEQTIVLEPAIQGELLESETPHGPLVHGRLGIAEESSGKLVTKVRTRAHEVAEQRGLELLLIDGSPGIGCPVIASITGVSLAVAVTEPTLSGQHDLQRVVELTRHFQVPLLVVVNRWDLHPELTRTIEDEARAAGATPIGRITYDPVFTRAQIQGGSVMTAGVDRARREITNIWNQIEEALCACREGGTA